MKMILPVRVKDIVGKVNGFLTVTGFSHMNKHSQSMWQCLCQCGSVVVVNKGCLIENHTTSCGCKKTAHLISINTTHGMVRTGSYRSWENMKRRCNDVNFKHYNNYGGRGIKVCDRWQSFINFHQDMGERPEGLTLDRINVDGNYEPSNCKWSTKSEQQLNRRGNNGST